jgi:hypothetical protein
VNNSVQKLVGGVIRVVLGFLSGTNPMPHPPCTAFITEKNRFLIFGWVTYGLGVLILRVCLVGGLLYRRCAACYTAWGVGGTIPQEAGC